MSGFFSKRLEDSVRSPSACAVRRMFGGDQCAASRITFVVPSSTSTRAPPKMPAMTFGPAGSVTSIISPVSVRTPSSVVNIAVLGAHNNDGVVGDLS